MWYENKKSVGINSNLSLRIQRLFTAVYPHLSGTDIRQPHVRPCDCCYIQIMKAHTTNVICITLMRIRILLVTLMQIRMRIRSLLVILMRIGSGSTTLHTTAKESFQTDTIYVFFFIYFLLVKPPVR